MEEQIEEQTHLCKKQGAKVGHPGSFDEFRVCHPSLANWFEKICVARPRDL